MPGRAAPVSRGSFTNYSPPKGFSLTKQGHPGRGSGAICPVSPSPGLGLPPTRIPRLSTSHPSPAPPGCRFPAGWSRRSGNPVCLMGKQCGFEGRGQMLGDKKGLLSSGSWGWQLPPCTEPCSAGRGSCPAPNLQPLPGAGMGSSKSDPGGTQHQTLPPNTARLSPCLSPCPGAHPAPSGDHTSPM